ncbi:ead/Ea22-like family protein [Klebsiella pneumoniae]|uniref:ead/Ea22-like family protein n=1 Tax=Klebsiella pneumoniae TaxID=573 RepID=UPI002A9A91FF|nr:ead/Ea22-like family protein [Klebsiella pneumoniae]HEL6407179.1 ead/Ea22-like family protein [Klebsiella pneumoniae]
MTTDITELAQSLKAAAEKATPGEWVYFPKNTSIEYDVGSDESQGSILYVDSGDFTQAQTDRNGEFIALANPNNVIALVEALEKAQGMEAYWKTQCRGITDHCEELQARIAELEESNAQVIQSRDHYKRMTEEGLKQLAEARTVKLPDLRQIVSGDRYVWSDGVYNYSQDVKVALAAAGIKVEVE